MKASIDEDFGILTLSLTHMHPKPKFATEDGSIPPELDGQNWTARVRTARYLELHAYRHHRSSEVTAPLNVHLVIDLPYV